MLWKIATNYRGIIGGSYFRNVPSIVSFKEKSLITVKHDSESCRFAVDADIVDKTGTTLAEIRNNVINVPSPQTDLVMVSKTSRISFSNSKSGEILFDFRTNESDSAYDFELSLSTFLPNGLPLLIHPNRIRIGSSRILKPSLAFISFEAASECTKSAIRVALDPEDDSFEGFLLPNTVSGGDSILRKLVFEADPKVPKAVTTFVASGTANSIFEMNEPAYLLDVGIANFPVGIVIAERTVVTNRL